MRSGPPTRRSTKRAGQFQTHEVIEAVVSGPELPVLDLAHQVLRKERIVSPKAIRDVDAPTEALLLRTGEIFHGPPDHGSVEVQSHHQIRCEARSEAPEIVPAVRPDEVRDHMPSSPVSARELIVIERHGRR